MFELALLIAFRQGSGDEAIRTGVVQQWDSLAVPLQSERDAKWQKHQRLIEAEQANERRRLSTFRIE